MRYKQIKPISEQTLNEVNMSPTSLRQLASKINARAGMEFEMIVPNAEGSEEDFESEPDFGMDERARSIDDICEFFHDGDMNGRREIDRLRQSMEEDFYSWQQEHLDEAWEHSGFEYLLKYLKENLSDDEVCDELGIEANEDGDYPDVGSEEYAKLAQKSYEENNSYYDSAREEFDEEYREDHDETDWLDDAGLDHMTNIADNYDITWPYYTSPSDSGDGRSPEDIADEFSRAIGRPVNAATSYHGARREEGHYVVEPDGSLEASNRGDTGLEFVSPPLPIGELLSDLQKVKKWADSEGCYTGADYNTGLHINVSVQGYTLAKLDYVKLALLMGDEYVLREFERTSNNYCKSALGIIKDTIKRNPHTAREALDKMKEHVNVAASKAIHGGTTGKFTSINTKDGYIEFRSPGGDWLNNFYNKIEPTLLRFVVALDAAIDEDKYKQEYLKKLYKLLAPSGDKSTIEYFAKYVAGEIPQAALKSFVRQAQRERTPKLQKLQYYNVKDDSGYVMMFQARNPNQAMQMAREHYPSRFRNIVDVSLHSTAATQQPAAQPTQTQGIWGIWIIGNNRFSRIPNTLVTNNVLLRFPSREAAEQWIEQSRAANPRMRTDIEVREIEPTEPATPEPTAPVPGSTVDRQQRRAQGEFTGAWRIVDVSTGQELYRFQVGDSQADANEVAARWLQRNGPEFFPDGADMSDIAVYPIYGQAQGEFTGAWKIVDPQGNEIYRFSGVGNSQSDANRVAIQWLRDHPEHMQGGVEVLPIMGDD